jgi:hypothetical protein
MSDEIRLDNISAIDSSLNNLMAGVAGPLRGASGSALLRGTDPRADAPRSRLRRLDLSRALAYL